MDEIVAIDINETLDMYVTLSRDGTIALRCLRTSQLWQHFMLIYKPNIQENRWLKGFTKNFKFINALKLSCHGYIAVCGPSSRQPGVTQYLIYSINGDLLRSALEQVEVKSVFLNTREDQLIIATNYVLAGKSEGNLQGNIRVLNLYGLEKIANLSKIMYLETIQQVTQDNKDNGRRTDTEPKDIKKIIPSIQAMAVGLGERNINIFFVKKEGERERKEIICFDSGMDAVWAHFQNYGIAK